MEVQNIMGAAGRHGFCPASKNVGKPGGLSIRGPKVDGGLPFSAMMDDVQAVVWIHFASDGGVIGVKPMAYSG